MQSSTNFNINKSTWPWVLNHFKENQYDCNNFPKISIITPSYNQGAFIEETIRSIIYQNYPNLEYIIIDGGSTDNTLDIISKYKKFIDVVISESDYGQSDAINKGWKLATGSITTWVNSDDILAPNCLFEVAKLANESSEDFIIVGNVINFTNNTEKYYQVTQKNINFDNIIKFWDSKCIWHQPGIFFSMNSIIKNNYLNINYHYSMDFDLLCKVLASSVVIYSNKNFTYFRLHHTSKGISAPQKTINEKVIIATNYWVKNIKLSLKDIYFLIIWFLKYNLKCFYYKNLDIRYKNYLYLLIKMFK
jgi:glycosyltransferase involved in cell wall biosynthesis